ncbi:MAG: arginine--tRNA ligase [Patescibacteria group bacterium]|nr:arginine--tRNA ligase [Patescibacteria group bacterium]
MVLVQEIRENVKNAFADACVVAFSQKIKTSDIKLEYPPDISSGDFNVGCFVLAQKIKKNPDAIATEISSKIQKNNLWDKVEAIGPYVNFKIKPAILFKAICESPDQLSDLGVPVAERIVIEYLSPNTNKPLHLGHVRNGILGMAIANLLEAIGHKAVKTNLINDRGVHICKSMVAYKKWGENETPETAKIKGDHFIGDYYVLYEKNKNEDSSIEEEAHNCLRKWERNDKEIVDLWKKMNNWVYAGFEETYKNYGFEFDKIYYESNTYKIGKEIVEQGIAQGVLKKLKSGAVVLRLPKELFGEDEKGKQKIMTLIRKDGTSVYMTQDLGTIITEFVENNVSRSIYVVGSEQKYHFKVLFFLLKLLGYAWADKCQHLAYGMVYLPEGKMKSREGKVVDADDLLQKMIDLAEKEILGRKETGSNKKEIMDNARKIALAAIKFFLLRLDPEKDIHFDPKESLAFEGMTGPYCQYAYARIQSIFFKEKAIKLMEQDTPNFSLLETEEDRLLAREIIQLSDAVKKAADNLNPSFLCRSVYELAKMIHQYYQKNRIINANISVNLAAARLELLKAASISLKKGLDFLGIETIEKM